jgi:hypothetical protein
MDAAPVIAVVTIERVEDAVPIAEALVAGGIFGVEVTLRSSAALGAIAGPDVRIVANGSPGVRRIVASVDAPLDLGSVRFEPAS